MKILLPFAFALLFSANIYAQSKDDEAMVLYQKAETAYEQRDYIGAEAALVKAQNAIGANPKILYLRVKALKAGIDDENFSKIESNYALIMTLLNQLFGSVNKATYPHEKYNELIGIKLDVADKLDKFKSDRIAEETRLQNLRKANESHFLTMQKREPAFLRDTFDVYMQRFVKDFNDCNLALFDPNAATVSSSIYLEHGRKFIKNHPELGPFPHHLEYNPTTKEIYIYHYVPDGKNTAKAPCCPDTIYTLDARWFYDSHDLIVTRGLDKAVKTYTIKMFFHPPGEKYGKGDLLYNAGVLAKLDFATNTYMQAGHLADLKSIMHTTGFDEYLDPVPVFAFTTPEGKSFYRNLGNGKWGEFAYPKPEPIFNFKLVSDENGTVVLFDATRNLYIRITGNECFWSRDKANINTKLYNGAWIKGIQLYDVVSSEIPKASVTRFTTPDDANIQAYIKANNINAVRHPSGLYYQIINSGDAIHPTITSAVTVNYKLSFLSGKLIEERTGVDFHLSDVVEGWKTGLPLIGQGGSILLIIPAVMAYGSNETGPIPANSVMVSKIELKKVD